MGQDLILIGFTTTIDPETLNPHAEDQNAAQQVKQAIIDRAYEAVNRLPVAALMEHNRWEAPVSDYNGADEDDVLNSIKQGIDEYLAVMAWSRFATAWEIGYGKPDRWFVTAGGSSWGDDPFDGYTALADLLDLLSTHIPSKVEGVGTQRRRAHPALDDVANAIGFVDGGVVPA